MLNLRSLNHICLFILIQGSIIAQSVEKVEPPFWWVGMKKNSLQLMVTGQGIARTTPIINSEEVSLVTAHKVKNPNYLFLDIEWTTNQPLQFDIDFQGAENPLSITYDLKPRENGNTRIGSFDNSDVIYLITPDRFANGDTNNDALADLKDGYNRSAEYGRHGGDIQGIIDHLGYIKDLGFTAIWLNPILENDQPQWSYHGYATTDYYKVDPRFGSNDQYAELCKKANEMGIGVIMDIIVNHCGSEHSWLSDPPMDDWVNYQDVEYQNTNHRKYTLLDPYAAPIDRKHMVEGWFVPAMPDLNQRNPYMATYLIQNSIWWVERVGLAGIRQDTYSYPFKEFMTDWTCAIREEFPDFNIVGEEWVDDPAIIGYWQEGSNNKDGNNSCLPSLMDFPMCMNLHMALREEEQWNQGWVKIYETLAKDFQYPSPNDLVIFPDNHDMSRIYTQVNEDYDLFKMALTYVLTMRGIPQLYYGTEILMSNTGSESHGIIRSDYPGGWEGDTVNAFTNEGLSEKQIQAKEWLTKLLQWRQDKTAIHNGQLTHYAPVNGAYVYFRYDAEATYMIILNKNTDESALPVSRFADHIKKHTRGVDVSTGIEFSLLGELNLSPRSSYILELD